CDGIIVRTGPVIERLTEVAYFLAASFSSGQRKNALGYFAATYTEIYACISAGLQVLGATVTVCGRMSIQPRWVLPRSLFGSR
ncbi:MAG: hypothetical protein WBX78_01050, partial [Pseudolabrys sp.]